MLIVSLNEKFVNGLKGHIADINENEVRVILNEWPGRRVLIRKYHYYQYFTELKTNLAGRYQIPLKV